MGPGDPFSSVTGYRTQAYDEPEPEIDDESELETEADLDYVHAPSTSPGPRQEPPPQQVRYVQARAVSPWAPRWVLPVIGVATGSVLGVTQVVYGIGPALIVLVWIIIGLLLAWLGHVLLSGRLDFRGALAVLLRRIERH